MSKTTQQLVRRSVPRTRPPLPGTAGEVVPLGPGETLPAPPPPKRPKQIFPYSAYVERHVIFPEEHTPVHTLMLPQACGIVSAQVYVGTEPAHQSDKRVMAAAKVNGEPLVEMELRPGINFWPIKDRPRLKQFDVLEVVLHHNLNTEIVLFDLHFMLIAEE